MQLLNLQKLKREGFETLIIKPRRIKVGFETLVIKLRRVFKMGLRHW